MTITQLECLYALGKTLNFSAAAKELYISQPALSKQISHMENELGFKLLNRSNKSVSFTKQGALFYDSCAKIVQEYHSALKQCQNSSSLKLNLGYFIGSQDYILKSFVGPFMNKYPDFSINPIPCTANNAFDSLKNGQIDLLLSSAYYPNQEKEIRFEETNLVHYCGIMNKNNPLAKKKKLKVTDFNGLNVIPNVKRNENEASLKIEKDILKYSPDVNLIQDNETIDAITLSILTKNSVAILPETRYIDHVSFVSIPFDDQYSFPFGFFYLAENPQIKKLIQENKIS